MILCLSYIGLSSEKLCKKDIRIILRLFRVNSLACLTVLQYLYGKQICTPPLISRYSRDIFHSFFYLHVMFKPVAMLWIEQLIYYSVMKFPSSKITVFRRGILTFGISFLFHNSSKNVTGYLFRY